MALHPTAQRVQDMAPRLTAVVVYGHQPSASTQIMPAASAVCTALKQLDPQRKILLVGGHVAALARRTLQEEEADFVCAGDRRVDVTKLGANVRQARGDEVREATGFAIGGVPPIGHDRKLRTVVDASLRRFETVWCAGGTPHAVFPVATNALLDAIPNAQVREVE